MRITRRTSGGRGEYEISEPTPQGVTPNNLVGRRILLALPNGWTIDTGTLLTAQGGKRRLRLIDTSVGHMQVQRQLAAALLLPEPVRADQAFGVGEPVLQRGRYAIEHIAIADAELRDDYTAVLKVETVILRNGSIEAAEIDVQNRTERLRTVWAAEREFPREILDLIEHHRTAVTSGSPITSETEAIVQTLQATMSEKSSDIGILYSQQTDVLDALQAALGIVVLEPVVTPDQVDPQEPEVRLRTVKEWKRWANARGPKSARFRSEVRGAYRATCVICGDRFPPTSFSAPGVDAAHILPWNQYDLDEVCNGLCLCKLHHWAFDEGLVVVQPDHGSYVVDLTNAVEEKLLAADAEFSVEKLKQARGRILEDRLPGTRAHWPKPEFLELLNSTLQEG